MQALEERLAKRRYLAMMAETQQEQDQHEIAFRIDAHNKVLTDLVDSQKMMDRQRDELMKQYEQDMQRAQMVHDEGTGTFLL